MKTIGQIIVALACIPTFLIASLCLGILVYQFAIEISVYFGTSPKATFTWIVATMLAAGVLMAARLFARNRVS